MSREGTTESLQVPEMPAEFVPDFPVTIVAKAKNGYLWKLVKHFGSQSALGKFLGLTPTEIGPLVNMRRVPNLQTPKYVEAENRLMKHFGLDWDTVLPEAVRRDDFLAMPKELEISKRVPLEQLSSQFSPHLMIEDTAVEAGMLSDSIDEALKKLPARSRLAVELRLGLNGNEVHTCAAGGLVMGISSSRFQQIYDKAIIKLQQPRCSSLLIEHLPDYEPPERKKEIK